MRKSRLSLSGSPCRLVQVGNTRVTITVAVLDDAPDGAPLLVAVMPGDHGTAPTHATSKVPSAARTELAPAERETTLPHATNERVPWMSVYPNALPASTEQELIVTIDPALMTNSMGEASVVVTSSTGEIAGLMFAVSPRVEQVRLAPAAIAGLVLGVIALTLFFVILVW